MGTSDYLKERIKVDLELLKLCSVAFLALSSGLAAIFIKDYNLGLQGKAVNFQTIWVLGFLVEFALIVFFFLKIIAINDLLDKLSQLTTNE